MADKVQKAVFKINESWRNHSYTIVTENCIRFKVRLLPRVMGRRAIEDGSKVPITDAQILRLAEGS